MRIEEIFRLGRWTLPAMALVSFLCLEQGVFGQVFSNGDVFVAVGHASVQWRRGDGTLLKTLVVPVTGTNINTTGMAFDKTGNLYVTMFDSQAVAVFNNTGAFVGMFGSGYNSDPESISIDASGNVYVGQADGSHLILKFSSTGAQLASFLVATERRGSDWVDLGSDQCTMYYTSEGTHVKEFNVCTSQQLSDLDSTALSGFAAYAHRLLPNGDTLVADSSLIVRLDDTGTIIQTYSVTNQNTFFALNLDPDGKSFWSADLGTGNVFKFDIASGSVLVQFNASTTTGGVGGLVVKGEITAASTPRTGSCVTRNARFWFTHPFSSDTNCVTLLRALQANVGGVSLGFIRLPLNFENGDNVKDVNDALIEAFGLYWKSSARTGEASGSQNAKQPASKLCTQRKLLSIELIAATANVELLGTDPADCMYTIHGVTTNFPQNLLQQARVACRGEDPTACATMTLLLRKFNQNGVAQNFIGNNLTQCSPTNTALLRSIARDPTTQLNCPGLNSSCDTAEAIVFKNASNPFAAAKFSESISLVKYQSTFSISTSTTNGTNVVSSLPPPACALGGPGAAWMITPDVGQAGRQFTVDTRNSNVQTVLSVFSGTCSNLTSVTCGTGNMLVLNQSEVVFTTDGVNTFYIIAESANGSSGRLTLNVSSP